MEIRRGGLPALAAVAVGGAIGSILRSAVGGWLSSRSGGLPWGVLTVNLAGSLFIGFYLARRERSITSRWSLHFWAIGVAGSFTTFSAFTLEVVDLLGRGRYGMGVLYLAFSVLGGLLLASIGSRLGSIR